MVKKNVCFQKRRQGRFCEMLSLVFGLVGHDSGCFKQVRVVCFRNDRSLSASSA
jgi:hypothetical protein